MTNSSLLAAVNWYKASLQILASSPDNHITRERVLRVLNARDLVATALSKPDYTIADQFGIVLQLDEQLKQLAQRFSETIDLADLRASFTTSASKNAWWWNLEALYPPPRKRWDWLQTHLTPGLWTGLSLSVWTVNLSLLVNVVSRFLTGGPDLIGVVLAAVPSLLALLQAKNQVAHSQSISSKPGSETHKVTSHSDEEAKLVLAALPLFSILVVLFFSLPWWSDWYNQKGLKNYQDGKVESAIQDYQRAIALHPDNPHAHFNLGNVYEDLQEFDSAQREYLLAVKRQLPEAYNNLARLHIRDKQYAQAASLIQQGLQTVQEDQSALNYSLLKNLGWVRFEQKRYGEAKNALLFAIAIANSPEAANHVEFPGSAYCLMAQVLEKQHPKTIAKTEWEKCRDLSSRINPDEDTWFHLAQEKVGPAKKP